MRKVRNKDLGIKAGWTRTSFGFWKKVYEGGTRAEYEKPIETGPSVRPIRTTYPKEPLDTSSLPRTPMGSSHIAISEDPNRIWELCRLLKNPKRLDLLARIYREKPGGELCGYMVKEAWNEGMLNQAATSEYLKDLARIGLLRRARRGRMVNYAPDCSNAEPAVRDFAELLRYQMTHGSYDMRFSAYLPPLSNAFRARVIHAVAMRGRMATDELCRLFNKERWALIRDLEPAVKGTLLDSDDGTDPEFYIYAPPDDPLAQRLVELAR